MSPLRRPGRASGRRSPARPMPARGGAWVLPRRFEREERPAWTRVGALGSSAPALVDPGGLVAPGGGRWALDWWVGADDRWHLPSREAAVRQRLLDAVPVVETALRVPGGDVVSTAFGVLDGGAEAVVVEWSNRTPVPVALALAVRPFTPLGRGSVQRIDLDASLVRVDGMPAVLLPRSPNRTGASRGADGDVAATILAGSAEETWAGPVLDDAGTASAAFVFPLPHGTALRAVVPVPGGPPAADRALPGAEQVARGWIRLDEQGMRLDAPDRRFLDVVRASRCSLLLAGAAASGSCREAGWIAAALADHGFGAEAAEVLLGADLADDDGTTLWALERVLVRAPDRAVADALVVPVADAVERLARARPRGAAALRGIAAAASVFDLAGEDRAARDAERTVERLLAEGGVEADADPMVEIVGPVVGPGAVTATVRAASPTLGWSSGADGQSLEVAARFLVAVRDLVLREDEDGLELCPELPGGWEGSGLEVHDAPTRFGPAGYAVRWHGHRPALLWQVEVPDGVEAPLLRSPGLDPTWGDPRPVGEALLAPFSRRAVPSWGSDEADPGSFR